MSYLTEEEARKQECIGPVGCGAYPPETPIDWEVHKDASHVYRIPPKRFCIAGDCKMVWRWRTRTLYSDPAMRDAPMGYCGLAGTPPETLG